MRSRVPVILLAALALAGCVGGSADLPTTTLDSGQLATDATVDAVTQAAVDPSRIEVPVWSVGDAWTGTAHEGEESRPYTIVVTKVEGDAYTVETTDGTNAGWDAMFDVSYLGKIRARDLAGSQQGQPVQFFDFPLTDGKTWTTTWDGLEVKLTATQTPRGYDIAGTVDDELYVELDYVPALRWWSKLQFVEGYGITLDRVQSSWTGTLATATAKLLYEGHPAAPVGSPGVANFTMDDAQSYGIATVAGGGTQWARAFYLIQPDGLPFMGTKIQNFELEGAGPRGVFLYEEIPALAGTWGIAAPSVHDPAGAFYVQVHEIAIVEKAFP